MGPALGPEPCTTLVKLQPAAANNGVQPRPSSCDTFVALPPATADGSVIFGKNSDRSTEEVQEVVAFPGGEHSHGSTLRCTYITIPQAPCTHAVVLSKPTWMWGCEMGANEAGVVCGNEAVWTVEDSDGPDALLGMDLVRLALERGGSASEAVDVIVQLLEEHGQGGSCEERGSWTYHNSFLVADASEAWVVETAGRWWAAQRVAQGVRNISNCLSIRTTIDRCSAGLQEYAREHGLWDGSGQFDFAATFSDGGAPPLGQLTPGREANGYKLLQKVAGSIDPPAMMAILRDRGSGVCMCDGSFRSNGSQVSRLTPLAGGSCPPAAQHWFTATPDPQRSIYKPFAFAGQQLDGSPHTAAVPALRNPPHPLWQAWQAVHEKGGSVRKPSQAALQELEARGLQGSKGLSFAEAVDEELRLYGAAG